MDSLVALLVVFVALLLLDVAALRWGADTRGRLEDDHQRSVHEGV